MSTTPPAAGFNVAQRARGLSELRDLVGRTKPSKLALALWLKFFTVGAGFLPGARSCLMSRALVQDLRRSPDVADVMLLAMASVHGGLILLEHADPTSAVWCCLARRAARSPEAPAG